MSVTELQFCFILIKALSESYSTVASTILATGELKDLTLQKIQDQILNEKGRQFRASVSLNNIAPLKKKDDEVEKDKIKCFYCKKSNHKANECWKKKKDLKEKDKKKKEKGNNTQTVMSCWDSLEGTSPLECCQPAKTKECLRSTLSSSVVNSRDLPVSSVRPARWHIALTTTLTHWGTE